MCNVFQWAVKNLAWIILSSLVIIFNTNAQRIDSLNNPVDGNLSYQDSVKNGFSSAIKDLKLEKDSTSSKIGKIHPPELKNIKSEFKDQSQQATDKVKGQATGLLDGEGLTNENAQEKVSGFLKNTVDEGKSGDKATGVLKKGTSGENIENEVKGLGDNPDKILDKLEGKVSKENLGENAKRIFTDKEIKFAYDSFLTKVDWNVVNALLQNPQAVSEGSILEAVFVKFPGLTQLSKTRQDATLLSGMMGSVNPTTSLASLAAVHLHDLQNMKVDDSLMANLPPLRGRKLDDRSMQYAEKYWKKLDSLRTVNLKESGLKLGEKKLSNSSKESIIKKRLRFFQKIYFEGIVGLFNGAQNGNLNLIQLSPSFGYHLHKNFSLGLGPSVILQVQEKELSAILGMRSFAKYELLKYNVYFQLEHNLLFPHVERSNIEELNVPTQHAFFGGLGYLLPISGRIAINLNIMYRISGDTQLPGTIGGSSPWIYRIGISSNRLKKNI